MKQKIQKPKKYKNCMHGKTAPRTETCKSVIGAPLRDE